MAVGNLEFINSTSVSAGVTTVNVDNVFSADYDVYYCNIIGLYHNVNVSNGVEGIRFIDSGGSVISATEYDYALLVMPASSAFTDTTRATNANYLNMNIFTDQLSDSGGANLGFYVFNPYDSSSFTFTKSQMAGKNSGDFYGHKGIGVHKVAETIRGFQLYESNGARTFGGGTINVYGLASK